MQTALLYPVNLALEMLLPPVVVLGAPAVSREPMRCEDLSHREILEIPDQPSWFGGGLSYYSGGGGQSAHGNWINVGDRYLGLAFQLNGKTHFGWARLTVNIKKQGLRIKAVLTGYAYETEPDTPIIAGQTSGNYPNQSKPQAFSSPLTTPGGQPATLGMLALGQPAMAIWRREEPAATK